MLITYDNEESFYDGISEMVKRGLTFEADAQDLHIILTGGF